MEKSSSILVAVRDLESSSLPVKAVTLARVLGARIEVLSLAPPEEGDVAARFSKVFGDDCSFALPLGDESPADGIVRRCAGRTVALVMTDADAKGGLRQVLRAASDMALATRLEVPLLRVGARPWRREMCIVAVVDAATRDTDIAIRATLNAARLIASRSEATLDVLYADREAGDDRTRMERAVRIARFAREHHVDGDRLRVVDGSIDKSLSRLVATLEYDIVVASASPLPARTSGMDPSLVSQLVNTKAGDVMLVTAPRPARRDGAAFVDTSRETRAAHP